MKQSHYKKLEPLAELADETATELLTSNMVIKLKKAMQEASVELGNTGSITFEIVLNVNHPYGCNSLRLAWVWLESEGAKAPQLCAELFPTVRFLVDGTVCELPNLRCPSCWGRWRGVLPYPDRREEACGECGYRMGHEIKLLIDDDLCPYCRTGRFSSAHPKCEECGFEIDPASVVWSDGKRDDAMGKTADVSHS